MAIFGSLVVSFHTDGHQFFLLFVNLLTLAVAAMAEEVAFRGYAFQRLIDAIGPTLAVLLMSVLFAVMHLFNTNATAASTLVTVLAGWLLSIAYLRTRALWLPWGLHFAWNASMALLFGLPVSGLVTFNSVVTTYARGPLWLTGGGYGPEGSAVAVIVIPILVIVLVKVTRDYAYKYAQPVVVAGGIPVDLDAISRRQHEAAMGTAAVSEPKLVQILPVDSTPNGASPRVPEASEMDALLQEDKPPLPPE
jgi:hypothetical protein